MAYELYKPPPAAVARKPSFDFLATANPHAPYLEWFKIGVRCKHTDNGEDGFAAWLHWSQQVPAKQYGMSEIQREREMRFKWNGMKLQGSVGRDVERARQELIVSQLDWEYTDAYLDDLYECFLPKERENAAWYPLRYLLQAPHLKPIIAAVRAEPNDRQQKILRSNTVPMVNFKSTNIVILDFDNTEKDADHMRSICEVYGVLAGFTSCRGNGYKVAVVYESNDFPFYDCWYAIMEWAEEWFGEKPDWSTKRYEYDTERTTFLSYDNNVYIPDVFNHLTLTPPNGV